MVKNWGTGDAPQSDRSRWLLAILIAIVGVSAVILTFCELKGLQVWELNAYHRMLRLRTPEKVDSRIVLVTISEADLRKTPWALLDKIAN
ncbi:MAG: hypothetical protein HRU34_06230 [Richelia sp.]|nr:hypothetical protein [Richelia sp.]CDN16879.1 serine/threonine kinase [Richelia intracellularis]